MSWKEGLLCQSLGDEALHTVASVLAVVLSLHTYMHLSSCTS